MKYFLGIRLPKDLEAACEEYRRAFRAPRTAAHITVIPPFVWERDVQELFIGVEKVLREVGPLNISGSGIGSFGTRVLFINVNLTPELNAMQKALAQELRQMGVPVDKRSYRPHITLATRLNPRQFSTYQDKLEGFDPDYSFLCSNLCLFHFTQEGRWEEYAKIPLGGGLL